MEMKLGNGPYITLWWLGFFDCVATVRALSHGYGVEKNPLMAALIDSYGLWWFAAAKMAVTIIGCVVLWRHRSWRAALFLCCVYFAVALWHVVGPVL